MTLLLVALAGGLGAALRFIVDSAVSRRNRTSTPIGTVVVNTTACFLLGLLAGWLESVADGDALTAVLGVGLLGGYSTFSTASVEAARLLLEGRGRAAAVHAAVMLVLGLLAAALGLLLGRA